MHNKQYCEDCGYNTSHCVCIPVTPESTQAEILNTEISDQSWNACDKFMSSLPYTTLALKTIEEWLRSEGDTSGAELMKKFTAEYVNFEAKTLCE